MRRLRILSGCVVLLSLVGVVLAAGSEPYGASAAAKSWTADNGKPESRV